MIDRFPPVSFVIPVLNGGHLLPEALESIRAQDYPGAIEIVIADGGSTDDTVVVARRFGCRVVDNPQVICETGVSVGIREATHEILCIMADDNRLPDTGWLRKMVKPLMDNSDLVGSSAVWFHYDRNAPAADRYCSLYGVNDPLAFYLRRRDRLMPIEKRWTLDGRAEDKGDYYLVEFGANTLLTLGSQGFVARKHLLQQTNWSPYFFHIDSCHELLRMGHGKFAMVKAEIVHLHSKTVRAFIRKLHRNITLYLQYRELRGPSWATAHKRDLILAALQMVTFVRPLWDSMNGYRKLRDGAWFLHPLLCFVVPFLYGAVTLRHAGSRVFRARPAFRPS